MAVMENETWPHPSYVPHYLLRGDPFSSRLSREADIVAAFYICIIGQSVIMKFLPPYTAIHIHCVTEGDIKCCYNQAANVLGMVKKR